MAAAQHKVTLPFILGRLRTNEQELSRQGIVPGELLAIYNDYLARRQELSSIAAAVSEVLLHCKQVHAVRHRLKDPLHLLRKIIRKKKEYPHRTINRQNYLGYLNDLAGVRALYLYKEDWVRIGQHIRQVWELKRPPHAYTRHNEELHFFSRKGCRAFVHPTGYSAIHFVVATQPNRQRYFVEIQLRTLLEETWSELDHSIRYPDHCPGALLEELLFILNRFTANTSRAATAIRAAACELERPVPDKARLHRLLAQLPLPEADRQRLLRYLE